MNDSVKSEQVIRQLSVNRTWKFEQIISNNSNNIEMQLFYLQRRLTRLKSYISHFTIESINARDVDDFQKARKMYFLVVDFNEEIRLIDIQYKLLLEKSVEMAVNNQLDQAIA